MEENYHKRICHLLKNKYRAFSFNAMTLFRNLIKKTVKTKLLLVFDRIFHQIKQKSSIYSQFFHKRRKAY